MPFTPDELANINAASLINYIDKGTVFKQNVANKPMLDAFNSNAGSFSGGNLKVSWAVKSGQGGGALAGFTGDDQLTFYNPTGIKRAEVAWKEHHIGMQVTMTELKIDGIEVTEDGANQNTSPMDGREETALANLLDEKNDTLGEDYSLSLDLLVHGDGSTDAKALAGIQSIILDSPAIGTTFNIGRVANSWHRNRAATAAYGSAGGQTLITSATTAGGALIEFMEKEWLQLSKFRTSAPKYQIFAGSDWIAAYRKEMRANGFYTQDGLKGTVDGSQGDLMWHGIPVQWDPTLDNLGLAKRCYVIDMGKKGLKLLYMNGKRMKKHHPARPFDRMVMYNGITTTAVMVAKQLNTSGVYDIA